MLVDQPKEMNAKITDLNDFQDFLIPSMDDSNRLNLILSSFSKKITNGSLSQSDHHHTHCKFIEQDASWSRIFVVVSIDGVQKGEDVNQFL